MSDEIKKEQEQPETEKEGGEDLSDEQLEEASGGGDLMMKGLKPPLPETSIELNEEDLTTDLTKEITKDSFGEVIPKLNF
ncbi:MAG: hypothetical protein O7G86_15665 [Gammaproteobacteria bacterium]|nr:hypothetical protein [Gammaproteobacteria bacterium]